MPRVPTYTKCKHLGCKNPKEKIGGYCQEHGGKTYIVPDADRKAFNNMYSTNHWKQVKKIQLSKHPLCASCLVTGHIRSANHVDHLFAWSHIGEEAFKRNVFQSLCASCHTSKTLMERKGIYQHYINNQVINYAIADYQAVMAKYLET